MVDADTSTAKGGRKMIIHDCDFVITLPARQRAEAFLRTLGKWEEGE